MPNAYFEPTLTKLLSPQIPVPFTIDGVAAGVISLSVTASQGGHGLLAAESVIIVGVTGTNDAADLNGTRTVATVTSSREFTISNTGIDLTDGTTGSGFLVFTTSAQFGRYGGLVRWADDTIRLQLVDTGAYTPDVRAHDYLDDIPGGARIGSSVVLAGKTTNHTTSALYYGGVADANNVVVSAVTGATVEALVLYKDTGTEATSPLILYLDTATGLPFTPNSGDVTISWDNGNSRIFKI